MTNWAQFAKFMSQYNSYICYAACQLTLRLPDPLVDSQLGIHTNARQNFKDHFLLVQFVGLFGCYHTVTQQSSYYGTYTTP